MGFVVNDAIDDFSRKLEQIANQQEMYGRMLYEGAAVVADQCKANIRALPVTEGGRQGSSEQPIDGVTKTQKKDLEESFGIAKMEEKDGTYNVRLGFDGYGSRPTEKYPKGVPNAMLARAVESGTSFRRKHPFIRPAVNEAKGAAVEAMQRALDEEISKL